MCLRGTAKLCLITPDQSYYLQQRLFLDLSKFEEVVSQENDWSCFVLESGSTLAIGGNNAFHFLLLQIVLQLAWLAVLVARFLGVSSKTLFA